MINTEQSVGIGNTKISIIKYADDLVFLSRSKQLGIQKGLVTLHDFCNNNKLTANTYKSKLIYISKRTPAQLPDIYYNGQVLEWVDKFKYLGVTFSFQRIISLIKS